MKIRRRRLALRLAAGAVSLGVVWSVPSSLRATELIFTGSPYSAWEYAGNWSTNQHPSTGDIADIFVPQQVNYNVVPASSPVLQAVQIAGGNASSPAILYLENGTVLQVSGGIYLGSSVTSQTNPNSGPGQIEQSFGQIQMSSGSVLAVDPSSTYQLGSSGQLFGGTENLGGTFSQSGSSTNILAGGMALNSSGTYTLQNSAQLSADFINNSAVFNQSGGTVLGTTTGTTFNNSGTYLYSSGSFAGSITNNFGATLSISGTSIPFSQGIVNNGVMTVTNAGGNYAGPISGNQTGILNFNGSQNITLTGTNPFNGSTGVNGGTLTLAAPGGGALQGNVTVNTGAALVFGASAQFTNVTALLVSGGTINLAGFSESVASLNQSGGQFNLTAGGSLNADTILNTGTFNQFNGNVAGTNNPGTNFNNSGTFVYNAGTFTGSLTNNPGATVKISGNAIPFSQGILNNGLMTVTNATGVYGGNISGNGSLVFSGLQFVTLTGTDSFNGATNLAGGTLTLAAPSGAALQGTLTVGSAGTLGFGASSQLGHTTALVVNGGIVNDAGFAEAVSSLVLTGGQVNLSAGGSFTADTITSSGTFNQSNANVAGTNSANTTFNNSGTYLYSGGTFTGFFTNNPGAIVSITGGSIPFSQGIVNNGLMVVAGATGSYAGPISGNGTLNFNSSQSVTLTGPNSFTGLTTISGGTLTLSSPTGGALLGPVTVAAGGTLAFGADMQLTPAALLTVNGGVVNLAANNESIGTLALNAGQFNLTGTGYLSAASEQIAGTFNQANASFTVLAGGAPLNVTGSYMLQNSAVLDADTIQNTGTFNQSGGTIQGVSTSATNFNNSASYLISGGVFNGALNNATGATTSISGGNLNASVINNTGALLLLSSGTLSGTVTNSGTYNASGGSASGAVINTPGGIYLSSGANLTGSVTNSGSYNSSAGNISASVLNNAGYLFSGGTFNGSLNNATGATTSISGGNFNASVTNNTGALLLLSSGTLSGSVTNSGTYNASGGSASGTVVNTTGGIYLSAGANFTGSVTNSGSYNSSAGNITASVVNNASYLFTGGTFAGTVLNSAGATYNCTGGSSTGSVNNSTGATFLYSGGTFTGSFINNVGATMSITNGSSGATIPFSAGILDNGQMTVTGINATYSGPISGSGSIIFNGSAMVTLAGAGSFNGSSGITSGTLTLASTGGAALAGNVTVAAAGTLAFGANSQLANSTLLTVNSGTVDLNEYNESVGSLAMNAGQIVQSGGQPLDVVSGLVTIGKGSASISGGLLTSSTYNFNVANNATLAILGPLSGSTTTAATGLVLTGGGGALSIYGNSLLSSIDIKQGILQLSEGGTLGGDNLTTNVESAGTLSLYGETLTIGDLLGSGAVALGSGSLYVSSSAAGSTFAGTINGSGSLFKSGTGTLTLTGTDSASGSTTTNVGTLTVAGSGSIGSGSITAGTSTIINLNGAVTGNPLVTANGTVNFGANSGTGFLQRSLGGLNVGSNSSAGNGQVNVALSSNHANRTVLVTTALSFSGAANSWSGQLDLSNNDMVVRNGNLATTTNQVKSGFNLSAGGNWKGNGITSSAAAANTTHLTALGVIQNNNGFSQPLYGSGAPLGLFDGYSPAVADVLVKYTYFGDANLDGKVDGTDYSLIDNGYLNTLTGWFNGDFNYDGVIDGSDYTLIDNAFNTQGSSLADEIAISTSQIDIAAPQTTGVPEPAMVGMIGLGVLCSRRGRRHKVSKHS